MLVLHREIWRIIDYKDFYDKASTNRSVYTPADEFIRGWSDSTLLLFVFPEERLRQYPVSENDGEEHPRFSAGEKRRERREINSKRRGKGKYFVRLSLSVSLEKKSGLT